MVSTAWTHRILTVGALASTVGVAGCARCDGGYNACSLIVYVEVDADALALRPTDPESTTPIAFVFTPPEGVAVEVKCGIDADGHVSGCIYPDGLEGGIEVAPSAYEAEASPDESIEFDVRETGSTAGKTPKDIRLTVLSGEQTLHEATLEYDWELTDSRGASCQPCAEHFPEQQEIWLPS